MAMALPAEARLGRTERGTIYIVDDDEGVRDSLRVLLEAYDHVVHDFASAGDFLSAFEAMDEGCLLLDVNMPGMGGIELLELIRGRGDAIPTIVVTAEKDAAVIDRARRAGAYTVLKKPVDNSLLSSIDAVFARP